MPEPITEPIRTVDHKPHATFFKQSGWLMFANIAGGLMTLAVHPLNKKVPDAEYTAFAVLLNLVSCLPTMPLQMVLAQQTTHALTTGRERQLSGMIRMAWLWTFIVWLIAAAAVFLFQGAIVKRWQLPGTAGLLITLPVLLASLWGPMFSGVLLGRQDFFWIGWSSILGGLGRIGFAALFVLAFGMGAAGMISGTLIGVALVAWIAIWRTRDLWSLPSEPFNGRALLRQVLPLVFGFGAFQFMFMADTLFVKAFFDPDAMKPYAAAGTLSRGLLWVVMPLASVMFPKLVQSSIRREKSNLFVIVIAGTAALGVVGLVGLWLVGPFVVGILYKSGDIAGTVALIPWYAGAMIPLTMANVMVNDLLARERFIAVPFMVAVALAYAFAMPAILSHFPGRLEVALQTLGGFNLLLLLVCACFIRGGKSANRTAQQPA